MSRVCTKSDWVGKPVGETCSECGHTNVVHPGVHNPTLAACVLCASAVCVVAEDEHDGDVQVVTLETVEIGPFDLNMCRLHRDRLQVDVLEHLSIAEDNTDG